MLRNFATIGFIFLNIGSLSAEKISTPNTFSPTSVKEALSRYLNERSGWGTAPSQTFADTLPTNAPSPLEAYLARRDAWNASVTAVNAAPRTADELKRYLAQRDSWATAPARTSSDTMLASAPLTLKAYLARRDVWNGSAATAHAAVDTADALKHYLARRDRWGTASAFSQVQITQVQLRKTLQEHLSRRESWGIKPDRQEKNTRVAAATFRNARNDSPSCIEAVQEIIGSSVIQFSFGSAALTTQSRHNLKRLANATRNCPDIRIRVEGHTDSAGNAASNQRLSEARAASVANYLTTAGINEADLEAIGFGQTRPLVSNATSALRAQNRRIEFTVLAN